MYQSKKTKIEKFDLRLNNHIDEIIYFNLIFESFYLKKSIISDEYLQDPICSVVIMLAFQSYSKLSSKYWLEYYDYISENNVSI